MDNKYEGAISARTALVKSKNAATVRLGMMTGLDRVIAAGEEAGIESALRELSDDLSRQQRGDAHGADAGQHHLSRMAACATTQLHHRPHRGQGRASVVYQAQPSQHPRDLRDTTAYEVHTCLAEVLERGTADRTFTELGLKRFPLGGKTGTAYNFTDAWFVGYSSAVTCGVWAGFDKPQPIYRGAFSNQIALPIWANVMKATFADLQARAKSRSRRGSSSARFARASGKLATDKCFETVENTETGEKVQRRTTYFEIATEEQAPKDGCDVHGAGTRSFVKEVTPRGRMCRARRSRWT